MRATEIQRHRHRDRRRETEKEREERQREKRQTDRHRDTDAQIQSEVVTDGLTKHALPFNYKYLKRRLIMNSVIVYATCNTNQGHDPIPPTVIAVPQ